jgi:hypothetical protein
VIRRILYRGAAIVLGLALGCVLIEGGARLYLGRQRTSGPVGRWAFRASRPAPYEDAEYFSQEFLAESMQCLRLQPAPQGRFLVHDDFSGRFILRCPGPSGDNASASVL